MPQYNGATGEINSSPSLTVPDQGLTIHDLYRNHSRGLHSSVSERTPYYFEHEIPNFYDINDRIEYRDNLKQQYDELTEVIKDEVKQRALTAQKLKEEEDLEKSSKPSKNTPEPSSGD